MRVISLFAGIGGFDLQTDPDICQFLRRYFAFMGKSVTVRTKNDAVFKCVLSALALGHDVMRITRRFSPTAAHTCVGEQAPHRFVPSALMGVNQFAFVNVSFSFIPRLPRTSRHVIPSCLALCICWMAVLMTLNVQTFTPLAVKTQAHCPAAASTRNEFHLVNSVVSRYRNYSIYPATEER